MTAHIIDLDAYRKTKRDVQTSRVSASEPQRSAVSKAPHHPASFTMTFAKQFFKYPERKADDSDTPA